MNRISKRLSELKNSGQKALVTYIVNGDPAPDVTVEAMHTLVKGGANIIELGVPFSDPMAEGPSIQRGHERALVHNTSLTGTFDVVREFRKKDADTPIVLMGYANPIERMGYEACAKQAALAGVDGLLTVDLPAEASADLNRHLQENGLENIFLLAPTTTEKRMTDVVSLAGGFIYYVSLKGVTGAGHLDVASVEERINKIKAATPLPVLVGFGIKDAASAESIGRVSDGVVVGSVLVDAMGQAGVAKDQICQNLLDIVVPMRQALDQLGK